MGAKSTIDITRAEALAFIMDALGRADNETISRVLEELNDCVRESGDYSNSLGLHNFAVRG